MQKRTIIATILMVLALAVGFSLGTRKSSLPRGSLAEFGGEDIRVRFVCCDNDGQYSSVVYSRIGGGQGAFQTIYRAAPYLRKDDPGAAAAGLCGYLYNAHGYRGDTSGLLALEPAPEPNADGAIDWKDLGADSDVFLINVAEGTVKCTHGTIKDAEIHNLEFGSPSF